MNEDVFYNLDDIPFNEKESFNNTILLLSMVKSDYYYIIGFSRIDNIIAIGFDFFYESCGNISEYITVNFGYSAAELKIECKLNISIKDCFLNEDVFKNEYFKLSDSCVIYERFFEKDSVLPISIKEMNAIVLFARDDIKSFINSNYNL